MSKTRKEGPEHYLFVAGRDRHCLSPDGIGRTRQFLPHSAVSRWYLAATLRDNSLIARQFLHGTGLATASAIVRPRRRDKIAPR